MNIKPVRKLTSGAHIRVVSPSSDINKFPQRTKRALNALRSEGYQVSMSEHALLPGPGMAGNANDRAADIMAAFQDDSVDAILCSTGGYGANVVLEHLNYEIIAANPKPIIGFSDISSLLCAITAKAQMMTFLGPTLLPSFGDSDGIDPFTMNHFRKLLEQKEPFGYLPNTDLYTEELLWWEKEDNRPRCREKAAPMQAITDGEGCGVLLGGNLETFLPLVGTPYFLNTTPIALFIEEEGGGLSRTMRDLTSLRHKGLFEQTAAVIFGRTYRYGYGDDEFASHVGKFFKQFSFPVIMNIDAGHTEPRLTLPFGAKVSVSGSRNESIVKIEQNAVY